MKQTEMILTITGSDSTGGSGLQADMRIASALGGRAVSAITSITMQNTLGIQEFHDLPAAVVQGQIEAVADDMQPKIVKIGLLRSVGVVRVVATMLQRYKPYHIIYDPIERSSQGEQLMQPEVIQAVKQWLLPLCTYIVKPADRRTHGQGNVFAMALCVFLARGLQLEAALSQAREYLHQQPVSPNDGQGRSGELYNRFLSEVALHYHHYSDVAFYAEQLGISSRYLGQVTRRIAARSPKQLIEERLLEELKTALATTAKPLKELAAAFGFSSQAHMARFFKNQTGLSASEYRANNR